MTPIYHGMRPTVEMSAGLKLSAYEKEKIKAINSLDNIELVEKKKRLTRTRGKGKGYQTRIRSTGEYYQIYREYKGSRLYFMGTANEGLAKFIAHHTSYAIDNGNIVEMWKLFRKNKQDEAIEKYGDPELSGSFSQYF